MKNLFLITSLLLSNLFLAQNDTIKKPLSINAYGEVYYSYDFGNPQNHTKPGFMYSHNRHNEFTVNLALIKASYQTENLRSNLALAAGTYMNANYSSETGVLKNIYEANVGVKLSKTKDIWIDAGIMPSHIGWESAIGKDNWTLTRSMAAENSPYFETGAKLSYTTDNGKWYMAVVALNGWQRIERVEGNNTIGFGHQLTYKLNDKVSLNSSSFIGNDKPDSIRQRRYFHNLYGTFQINPKWGIIAGFDIGAEQKEKNSKQYNTWYTPVLIAKYQATEKSNISARVEYYSDKNGVMVSTDTQNGFQTWGYSLNYDYQVTKNLVWRIEGKGFSSKDKVFMKNNETLNSNYCLTTSFAINF